jgi:hypothetical protein
MKEKNTLTVSLISTIILGALPTDSSILRIARFFLTVVLREEKEETYVAECTEKQSFPFDEDFPQSILFASTGRPSAALPDILRINSVADREPHPSFLPCLLPRQIVPDIGSHLSGGNPDSTALWFDAKANKKRQLVRGLLFPFSSWKPSE